MEKVAIVVFWPYGYQFPKRAIRRLYSYKSTKWVQAKVQIHTLVCKMCSLHLLHPQRIGVFQSRRLQEPFGTLTPQFYTLRVQQGGIFRVFGVTPLLIWTHNFPIPGADSLPLGLAWRSSGGTVSLCLLEINQRSSALNLQTWQSFCGSVPVRLSPLVCVCLEMCVFVCVCVLLSCHCFIRIREDCWVIVVWLKAEN